MDSYLGTHFTLTATNFVSTRTQFPDSSTFSRPDLAIVRVCMCVVESFINRKIEREVYRRRRRWLTGPAPSHNVLDNKKKRERERERERETERDLERKRVRERFCTYPMRPQPPESESTGPLSVGLTQYVCVCVCIL